MEDTETLRAARAMRRAILGDAYVDGQTAGPDPIGQQFQDHLTLQAWGVWTRGEVGASRTPCSRRSFPPGPL